MSHIHVIHENDEWTAPLLEALRDQGLPAVDWHLASGSVDLSSPVPEGVFYNRMSASSHTRGHRFAPELTSAVLAWLERSGATVVNPSEALRLELSKAMQYTALDAAGIETPRTVATTGRDQLVDAARRMDGPFITKHNRAGKGLGVHLFESVDELMRFVAEDRLEASVDGITLVQQYIRAPQPCITRVEFIGQNLLYAVRVDTSGGFELCPADACEVGDAFCPAGEGQGQGQGDGDGDGEKFRIIDRFDHPLVARYEAFLRDHGVHVAAFEFIEDDVGRAYTYDINTNTNYNPGAEARAGISGMHTLAGYLGDLLAAGERRRAA